MEKIKVKGYFINDNGYVISYGEAVRATENFIESGILECKTQDDLCLRANKDRTQIEYVPILHMNEEPILSPEQRIFLLKSLLANSDFKALKFAEGSLTEEEFAPIRVQRMEWRKEINELEKE